MIFIFHTHDKAELLHNGVGNIIDMSFHIRKSGCNKKVEVEIRFFQKCATHSHMTSECLIHMHLARRDAHIQLLLKGTLVSKILFVFI